MTSTATTSRRLLNWTLRIGALVLVGWFVSGSVRSALAQLPEQDWHVRPLWVISAGVIYALALVPMGWFWRQTLAALGCPTPMLSAMFGYFLGHIGKYVPGKAMSVILRVAAVRKWVPWMRIALVAALLETLTMMAAGAFLAAIMSIFILKLKPLYSLGAIAMACIAGAPTLPPILRRFAAVPINRAATSDEAFSPGELATRLQAINFWLLARGWMAAAVCWLLQAVSLWATLRAIGVEQVSLASDLPSLLAAVSFAVVVGFLSQLPGGLGVRDALLMELLIPICGKANALVAAVLMRLIWLLSELAVCGILYIAARNTPAPPKPLTPAAV